MNNDEKMRLYQKYRQLGFTHVESVRKVNADMRLPLILSQLEL